MNSTLSKKEKDAILFDLRSIKPTLKLLYVTPELIATEHWRKEMEAMYKLNKLSFIAVDEAHCIRLDTLMYIDT